MVVAKAAAPLAAAWLWTLTGDYSLVLAAIIAMSIVMALAFWWSAWASGRQLGDRPA